ncbi:hypothetical protein [Planifilum fulgidum]|uniref:CDI toxin immunity protein n=1 Tax=Planifilum fulgidum TaxID=201973 RepID=UPI000B85A7CA
MNLKKVFLQIRLLPKWISHEYREKKAIEDDEDILEELYKNHVNINEPVYVFWNDADLPAIQTFIKNVVNVLEDVISVSFDTYIFCPKERYFVEYYHEGETFLGFY